jgi:hypothetical protein
MNSLARLPSDPNACSEKDLQRPSETVKVTRNEPVLLAVARRVHVRAWEASRTRTVSSG